MIFSSLSVPLIIFQRFISLTDLKKYRPGCVVYVDYAQYISSFFYPGSVAAFDGIKAVVEKELQLFFDHGIQPGNTFFFGFSYGGQMALHIGRDFSLSGKKIKRIDGD